MNAQGTSLYIKLVSDESDTGKGFKASWTSKHLGGNTGIMTDQSVCNSLPVICIKDNPKSFSLRGQFTQCVVFFYRYFSSFKISFRRAKTPLV